MRCQAKPLTSNLVAARESGQAAVGSLRQSDLLSFQGLQFSGRGVFAQKAQTFYCHAILEVWFYCIGRSQISRSNCQPKLPGIVECSAMQITKAEYPNIVKSGCLKAARRKNPSLSGQGSSNLSFRASSLLCSLPWLAHCRAVRWAQRKNMELWRTLGRRRSFPTHGVCCFPEAHWMAVRFPGQCCLSLPCLSAMWGVRSLLTCILDFSSKQTFELRAHSC